MTIARAVALALLLAPSVALAQPWESTFDRGRTTRLLRELHRFEQRMSAAAAVAEERADSPALRALADQQLADHRRLDDRIRAWASHHQLSIEDDEELALRAPEKDREVEAWFRELVRSAHELWIPKLQLTAAQTRYKPLAYFLINIARTLQEHQQRLNPPLELASKPR